VPEIVDLKPDSQRAVERFWAHELGVDPGFLATAPEVSCSVQRLYAGVQLFRRGGRLVVAAPPDQAPLLQDAMRGRSADEVFSAEWLQRVFVQDAERILGPAHVHYADGTSFRSESSGAARPISASDAAAYRSLAAALGSKEVEDSGFSGEAFPAFGAFSAGVLCAAASYTVWEPSIAHLMVATHPGYRRKGFASAAIGALAADALPRGLILQYRAVAWNASSLALARALGFRHYCSTLYVRLRAPR